MARVWKDQNGTPIKKGDRIAFLYQGKVVYDKISYGPAADEGAMFTENYYGLFRWPDQVVAAPGRTRPKVREVAR